MKMKFFQRFPVVYCIRSHQILFKYTENLRMFDSDLKFWGSRLRASHLRAFSFARFFRVKRENLSIVFLSITNTM